ncbi:MAG: alkaline phosphatase [Hyphomonadaceae bacterium]
MGDRRSGRKSHRRDFDRAADARHARRTYAKTNERDWEAGRQRFRRRARPGCTDIASQFIAWQTANGDGMEVAMAGGRAQFLPNTVADPEYPQRKGLRADGRNLMTEWTQMPGHVAITDEAGFKATNFDSDVKVLGLFEPSHMEYEHDRPNDKAGEPSLAEMTRAAITRLKRDPDGFVLMVEGGRIDHAHHAGNALRALSDVEALDEAVQVAREMTGDDDTLIIVTADHSHTLTISGYPGRNNPILGLVQYPGHGVAKGADGKPYTTLGYMNGPGAICTPGKDSTCERKDLTDVDTGDEDFLQQSLVPLGSETHGGEDVAVFASGPGSSLLTGTIEENEIFHVMARSLGLVK